MGYHIRKRESVGDAVRRIALEEVRGAIRDLTERQPNTHEAVHDFRKRCKKMRGLLRLIRPHLGESYHVENLFFRELSRELSYVRDAQALIEAIDRLAEHGSATNAPSPAGPIRELLIQARDAVAGGEQSLTSQLEAMVPSLEAAAARIAQWSLSNDGFPTLAAGLEKTFRRARRAMTMAYAQATDEHFHEWRKRVKYHWHHTLLLQKICPKFLKPHARLADKLAELLGQDHDFAVLKQRLATLEPRQSFATERTWVVQQIVQRQQELRDAMRRPGRQLQAETPTALGRRWHAYWNTWRQTDNSPE